MFLCNLHELLLLMVSRKRQLISKSKLIILKHTFFADEGLRMAAWLLVAGTLAHQARPTSSLCEIPRRLLALKDS